MDDGVQCLAPVKEQVGQDRRIPRAYEWIRERLCALIRRVWVEQRPGGHVIGTAICLSCLLEIGRYGDLIELLACARMRWWHWHHFGAEALARQRAVGCRGRCADGCRTPQGYDQTAMDRFCEDVLIKSRRANEAYRRYGLTAATGPPRARADRAGPDYRDMPNVGVLH